MLLRFKYKFELDQLGSQGGVLPGVYVLSGSTTPSNVSGSITEERFQVT
jgi:hypothetical protein